MKDENLRSVIVMYRFVTLQGCIHIKKY